MVLKTFRVAEAQSRDVGRGIARIDVEMANELGLTTGDIVEIKGKKNNGSCLLARLPR
jgi:transitional endoplasmic reticulum ATPase